jgi:eukaryotic-like serine/threonine-protein kinase
VFIAMELVHGVNLRRWLGERPRGWREVRDVFVAAGEGLRAIHAAGMVHRDFKPGNVLIDASGRVRVADLGLVRSAGQSEPIAGHAPEILYSPLTRSGIAGTPGYMAPEQVDGRPVDERTDQYAFCVALDEALPEQAPARLLAAVARGRSADPADRFPSMAALLAELRWDPAHARRRLIVGAAVVALASLAVAGFTRGRRDACVVVGPWNAEARAAVRAAFERSGRSYAADTFGRVAATLDGYAARLGAGQRTACEASATAAAACLATRRDGLAALVAALGQADGSVVDSAVQAASELPDIGACSDVRRLLESTLPEDERARAAIAALERRLAEVVTLEKIGRYREGLALAPAVVADAQQLGWPPLVARALAAHGELLIGLRDAGAAETVRAAWTAAARAGDDQLAAVELSRLIWVTGTLRGKPAEAEPLFDAGVAALARAGDPPLVRSVMLLAMGDVLTAAGRYGEARRLDLESVLLAEAARDAPVRRAASWSSLSVAFRRDGAHAEAEQAIRRAVLLASEALGPAHPQVAGMTMNLGAVLKVRGRYEEAIYELARGAAMLEAAYGSDSVPVGMAQSNLAEAYHLAGRDAEALAPIDRALAIKEKQMPPTHPSIGTTLALRALILVGLGRADDALASAERALELFRARSDPAARDNIVETYVIIAEAHAAAGRAVQARAALDQASGAESADYRRVRARVEALEHAKKR